jgi:hypothetical protein
MPSRQVLEIKILSGGGMFDLLGEMEAQFLVNSLGLFRNRIDRGRATPRANVSLVRVYTTKDFYKGVDGQADLLHLIGHADASTLQTGDGKSLVTASDVESRAKRGVLMLPEIVLSTNCKFQSVSWQKALKAAGTKVVIAASREVTPANLAAFDALEFLYHPQETYQEAPERLRRQLNQAVWEGIEIHVLPDKDHRATGQLQQPFAGLLDPQLLKPLREAVGGNQGASEWSDGKPEWFARLLKTESAPKTPRGLSSAVGLKDGVLAPPTGFEPVLPP